MKVSVIVPVFNAEKYLERCLDSLLWQSLEDMEIICVDDGSTDQSLEILRCYERDYERVHVYTQQNSFAGVARNHGLKYAQGEYVICLDCDDIFMPSMLLKMYQRAKETNSDICICGGEAYDNRTFARKKGWFFYPSEVPETEPFSYKDIPNRIYQIKSPVPWNMLILRSFIEENKLEFEAVRRGNDLRFYGMSLVTARRICTVNENLVLYRIGMKTNIQSVYGGIQITEFDTLRQIKAYLVEKGIFDEVKNSFHQLVASNNRYLITRLKTPDELAEYWDTVMESEDWLLHYDGSESGLEESTQYKFLCEVYQEGREEFMRRFGMPEEEADDTERVLLANAKAPLVSVIIPMKDEEKYIKDALDSVRKQTLQDLEVIVIDDGSSDESQAIVCDYAKNYDKISLYHFAENQGVGAARDYGISHAQGKYIQFLDSDDMLTPHALADLTQIAERDALEILYYDGEIHYDENIPAESRLLKAAHYIRDKKYASIMDGRECLIRTTESADWRPHCGMALYLRSFLSEKNIHFTDNQAHEDVLFTMQAMLAATKIRIDKGIYYQRRIHQDALTIEPSHITSLVGRQYTIQTLLRIADQYKQDAGIHESIRRCIAAETEEFFKCYDSMDQKSRDHAHSKLGNLDIIYRRFNWRVKEADKKAAALDKELKAKTDEFEKLHHSETYLVGKIAMKFSGSKQAGDNKTMQAKDAAGAASPDELAEQQGQTSSGQPEASANPAAPAQGAGEDAKTAAANPKTNEGAKALDPIQVVKRRSSGTPLVSLIVPMKDMEGYIGATLESIQEQTLKDLEVLVIDDDSTDSSIEIAKKFAESDDRISIWKQPVNRGLGAARNTALEHAEGKYIQFLDSDDLMDPESYARLTEQAEREKLDIIYFDGSIFYDDDVPEEDRNWNPTQYVRKHNYYVPVSGRDFFVKTVQVAEWRESCCMNLYRREFLNEKNIRFQEGIVHEDDTFSILTTLLADRVGVNPGAFYLRRVRGGSIMTTPRRFKSLIGRQYNIQMLPRILELFPEDEEVTTALRICLSREVGSLFRTYEETFQEDRDMAASKLGNLDIIYQGMNQYMKKQLDEVTQKEAAIEEQKAAIAKFKKTETYRKGASILRKPRALKKAIKKKLGK